MLTKETPTQQIARHEQVAPEWPLGTWEPFQMMTRMREAMDHMFTDLFRGVTPTETRISTRVPAVNLYQKNDDLIVECALPGLKKEEVEVKVTPEAVVISGEYKRKEEVKREGTFRSEIATGHFFREIRLPYTVKTEKTKASMDNGVLKITLPLTEPNLFRATSIKID